MANRALFPGSFDPFHLGHENLVIRALDLFDEIIVGIGHNTNKQNLFDVETRTGWVKELFAGESRVSVGSYSGLTVDYCRHVDAKYILRGLRNTADYQFEQSIAQMNRALETEIETIFLLTAPEYSAINSTILRDIIRHEGDVSKFVPPAITIK